MPKLIPTPRNKAGNNPDMPWSGVKANAVVAVDCGIHGAIVAGSSLADVHEIPLPKDCLEKRDFFKNLPRHGVDNLCTAFVIERRPATDKIPGGARRIYMLGFEEGSWDVISAGFKERISFYPQEWRRIAFPTLTEKPSGGLEWKRLEWRYTRFFTGDRLVGPKFYQSDNHVYGVSAAFCIWLAGCKTMGLLNIENEIQRIKENAKTL